MPNFQWKNPIIFRSSSKWFLVWPITSNPDFYITCYSENALAGYGTSFEQEPQNSDEVYITWFG